MKQTNGDKSDVDDYYDDIRKVWVERAGVKREVDSFWGMVEVIDQTVVHLTFDGNN